MTKLKLGAVPDEKPIKMSVEVSAEIHRDLVAYAEVLSSQTGHKTEPKRIIAPMLAKFMASDRGFMKARRTTRQTGPSSG
ncbi:DUF2274 domain-containing protein [Rhodobacteraceae bacterium M385]|nr:DUF2274 domain-containing protein [Rhodobacteraceae bacterium M385]